MCGAAAHVRFVRYGEAPDPTAGPGEVVVDIHKSNEITRINGGLIQAQL
jgi:hypothetical protein